MNDRLSLRASSAMSSLCSLLAVIGQSQSDLLAITPAKFVIFLLSVVHCNCLYCVLLVLITGVTSLKQLQ